MVNSRHRIASRIVGAVGTAIAVLALAAAPAFATGAKPNDAGSPDSASVAAHLRNLLANAGDVDADELDEMEEAIATEAAELEDAEDATDTDEADEADTDGPTPTRPTTITTTGRHRRGHNNDRQRQADGNNNDGPTATTGPTTAKAATRGPTRTRPTQRQGRGRRLTLPRQL